MADVISAPGNPATRQDRRAAGQPAGAQEDEVACIELMELLFFAYRDFISDPDRILEDYGFGRAHHRVLHFVSRNPGIRVAELLDILKITKQSLGRVLKQLIEDGFIHQREGASDRRQRLLFVTDAGRALALSLAEPQIARIRAALGQSGRGSQQHMRAILQNLINAGERDQVRRWIGQR